MNNIEEKMSKAKVFEDEARKLREEARSENQKNCPHAWEEKHGHNMNLFRVCCCGKIEFYNHYAGEWPS